MNIHLRSQHDIILGKIHNSFPLWPSQLRLDQKAQGYHATIWGQSGKGKSRLLEAIFLQHLNKQHGIGIIEPHHDLSFDCLTYLVSQGFFDNSAAYERLIYIDWGNGSYVPFNILAGDGEPEDIALNAFEGMLRVWPELMEAPLFKRLFLSAVTTLILNHLPITFLYQFLTDADFRHACQAKVTDPLIQQTLDSYDQLGRNQVQAAGSSLNRAYALSYHRATRMTLGQPDNWLDFRKWMNEGRSVILNLGNIGDPETRKLIGAMLMVQIEQAALSRKNIPPSQRTPFTLLVDEWSSFAAQGETIGTILEQARKFNLRLYLAGQSMAQISSDRLAGALENCKLAIVFGLGRNSAEIQARHIGNADPFAIKEEALTNTQHSQYLSVPEQFEAWTQDITKLSPQLAYVKIDTHPAVKIQTLNVPDSDVDPKEVQTVLDTYRQRYQRGPQEAADAISGITPASAGASSPTSTTGSEQDAVPPPGVPSPSPGYTSLFGRGNGQNKPSK